MTKYPNLLAGAKGLLGDCARILADTKEEYTIVGGWSPYLLNNGKTKHPGTHDVDLLFRYGRDEGRLKEIMQNFLKEGYMVSAKHNFQMLKVINVEGVDFVYNVDFLHAAGRFTNEEMFVDHLKLPVPLNEYCDKTYFQMSIVAPNSDSLFQYNLIESIHEKFVLPDGAETEIKFPLINEAGLIITKADSVKQIKRPRDSFDIYLAIKQARNYAHLVSIFRQLKQDNGDIFNVLYSIREALEKGTMSVNALKYMYPMEQWGLHSAEINDVIKKFFSDTGLEPKAKHFYDEPKERKYGPIPH